MKMQKLINLALSLCVIFCLPTLLHAAKKPNIILIITDDQGWADIGVAEQRKHPIETPNMDRIAKNGVYFTDAYASAPICSPSRAALLTGRYQQRFGYYDNWESQVGYDEGQKILPMYLKSVGYRTAAIGKWHLGWFKHNHPRAMGFDYHFGFNGGMHDYFVTDNGETWEGGPFDVNFMEENGKILPKDSITYMPKDLTDKTLDFISGTEDQPFFIYLAYTTPHGPHQALVEDLKRYAKDKSIENPHRKVVRAMYDSLDRNIGRILDYLDDNQMSENTLIIFTGDNGGLREVAGCDNGPLYGSKGYLSEGGIRTVAAGCWPAKWPKGKVYRQPILNIDFSATMLVAAGVPESELVDVEGVNLTPYVNGVKKGRPHDTLHWQMHHTDMSRWAVREGDWKLVKARNKEGLYNLKKDIGEENDLSKRHPEIVERLKDKHMNWMKKNKPSRVTNDTRRVHIWELRFRKDMGESSHESILDMRELM